MNDKIINIYEAGINEIRNDLYNISNLVSSDSTPIMIGLNEVDEALKEIEMKVLKIRESLK